MNSFDGILLSVGLGVDAAVVAFAIGLSHSDKSHRPGLTLAVWFGTFQALMAFLGWKVVTGIDMLRPWAEKGAAAIFIVLGLKLLLDMRKDETENVKIPQRQYEYLILAIATSIDALAAGVGVVHFSNPIYTIGLIGLVAFIMTWGGAYLSHHAQHFSENWAEAFGALILIFLGVKTLVW